MKGLAHHANSDGKPTRPTKSRFVNGPASFYTNAKLLFIKSYIESAHAHSISDETNSAPTVKPP